MTFRRFSQYARLWAVAARFIWQNMPYGHGRTLSPQVARNIADFVDSHARPEPREALGRLWEK